MKIPLAAAAIAALLLPLPAQDLGDRVGALRMAAELNGGSFTGRGADFLRNAARAAEFTVIGESHGNKETCVFTSWLLRELKDHGYGALATETGPCTTDHLGELAAKDGMDGVVRFIRQQPFSVAFLYWREEAQMFADAVGMGYQTWGLDQEFVGSARFLLSELSARAKDPRARELARNWHERAVAGFETFAETGDRSASFMAVVGPDDWNELQAAFAGETPEVRRYLAELRSSQEIYGLYHSRRFYENNRQRVDLMKRHLAERLRSNPDTKAVLKFGSAHSGRGYSPFDQLDVGNHAAEVAVARGGDSLHVYVFARRSIQEDGSARDFTGNVTSLQPFYAAQPESGSCVFDLRELRPLLARTSIKTAYPEVHELVFRYDVLVLLPEFHPSEALIPLPKGG